MLPKKLPVKPVEIPVPKEKPEIELPIDPEAPLIPEEDPDIIPEENPFETPPFELPEPGEGP
ncbi:hypothetical protein [Ferruginibacter profundus]